MAGSLARDRIDRLSNIDFKWALIEAVPWENRFNELVQYKAKHGDCKVPLNKGKLGAWVGKQRSKYMANSLAQDRVNRLNSIGFKWALIESVPWETRFNELVRYKAKHGDCNVPRRHRQLGMWVSKQRQQYKKGKLSQDRVDRLNIIGFKWALNPGPKGGSETRFDELVQYKAKNGDYNVPRSHGKLGPWVYTQRRRYKKNELSQDRIDRLNSIGFDWTPPIGRSRKRKSPPQNRSSSKKKRASLRSATVEVLAEATEDYGAEVRLSLRAVVGNALVTTATGESRRLGFLCSIYARLPTFALV